MQTARLSDGLYAITPDGLAGDTLFDKTSAILQSGAVVLQYRAKNDGDADTARKLCALCREVDACFIVNDDPRLAAEVEADGVHLGVDDPDITTARRMLGARKLIGVSCYDNLNRAQQAQKGGADYVAFGSFFASQTKPGAVSANLALLRAARKILTIPIVAIGGITPDNGGTLVEAGANLLAVISALYASDNPGDAASRYKILFRKDKDGTL